MNNCIKIIAKKYNMTTEEFINNTQEKAYASLQIPLGIYGKSILGLPSIKRGDDTYVPGLEVMKGKDYSEREIKGKSSEDYKIKEKYNVPDAPVGWWVSEKFDGQRAIWDGEKFISRGGAGDPRVYPYVPRWFIALMPPNVALDGEFFIARNSFNLTTSILRTKCKPESNRKKGDNSQEDLDIRWSAVKYVVFDIISDQPYEVRKDKLKEIVKERCSLWKLIPQPPYMTKGNCPLVFTEQFLVKSEKQLMEMYNKLVSEEAEGVMIRAPHIPYIAKRTKLILKMKLEQDSECILQKPSQHKSGEGKYKDKLGSFYCQDTLSKKYFYLGGMSDAVRENYNNKSSEYYHPEGTIISYQFNGVTPDGIPRHPRYKGIKDI
jgi:DNA ligase-1